MKQKLSILFLIFFSTFMTSCIAENDSFEIPFRNAPPIYSRPQNFDAYRLEQHRLMNEWQQEWFLTLNDSSLWEFDPACSFDFISWSTKDVINLTQNTDSLTCVKFPFLLIHSRSNIAVPVRPADTGIFTSSLSIKAIDQSKMTFIASDDLLWEINRADLEKLNEWNVDDRVIYATDKESSVQEREDSFTLLINMSHSTHPCIKIKFLALPLYMDR